MKPTSNKRDVDFEVMDENDSVPGSLLLRPKKVRLRIKATGHFCTLPGQGIPRTEVPKGERPYKMRGNASR